MTGTARDRLRRECGMGRWWRRTVSLCAAGVGKNSIITQAARDAPVKKG